MKKVKPSDLEMQVLSVLWERGPCTARDMLEAMPDGKQRAYTSILSVMQVMEKKGLLIHTSKGNAHVYSPAVRREQVLKPFLRKVVTEVFAGRPAALMQALLSETPVSDEELTEMRRLLAQAKSTKGPERKGD